MSNFGSQDFLFAVSKGEIDGHVAVSQTGFNDKIPQNATEDVVDQGGTIDYPTAARIHDLVSSSANDDVAGTGALTVEVFGLDASYVLQDEIVVMTGTVNKATASTYIRIFKMIVRTAGSLGFNDGDITATAQTDATVTCQITAEENESHFAGYTIPDNKTGFVISPFLSAEKKVRAFFKVRPDGEVFQTKAVITQENKGAPFQKITRVMIPVPAKADLKISVLGLDKDQEVSAGFDLVLVDD